MPIIILSDVQLPFGAGSGKVLTSDGSGNATWQELTNAGISATAAIAESKLALASDAAAGTASRRTLGTGGLQAAAGNDARFGDQRVPIDNSVTSAKIANGAIMDVDINAAAAIAPTKIAGTAVVTADIRLSDQRTPLDNSVTSAKIADGAIVNADISAGAAIAKSKLAALAIVNADVDAGAAIAYSKLALGGSVVAGDLAANAVTTVKIADLNVTTAKLADDAVTDAKLADLSVSTAHLQDGAVSSAKIGDIQVGTAKITNGAITSVKLGTGLSVTGGFTVAGGMVVNTGGFTVTGGSASFLQPSTANSSWSILAQMNGAATGLRYLILAQSGIGGSVDNEFYVLDNGTVRADGTIVGGGADYAEWMAHDVNTDLVTGDVVGLNLTTGKVRKHQAGDPMVGVISENPAFSAGNPLPMSNRERPGGYSLVGLIGRVAAQARQVTVTNGVVFAATNGKRLGYMLADGRTFLDIDKTP